MGSMGRVGTADAVGNLFGALQRQTGCLSRQDSNLCADSVSMPKQSRQTERRSTATNRVDERFGAYNNRDDVGRLIHWSRRGRRPGYRR
jgi:hypothetical protein